MLVIPVVTRLARNQQRAEAKARQAAHHDGDDARTPRWLSTLAASEWLRHSTEGYCATTEEAGMRFSAKGCRTGHKGGSILPEDVVKRGWLAAATECVSRCAGCERCRFISVSLKQSDCRPCAAVSQTLTSISKLSRIHLPSHPRPVFASTPLSLLLTPPRLSCPSAAAGSTPAISTGCSLKCRLSARGACWVTPARRSGALSASVSPPTPPRGATCSTGCRSAPTPVRPSYRGCPPRCRRQPRSFSG